MESEMVFLYVYIIIVNLDFIIYISFVIYI